jgi:Trk K+ transport system NAD-binding subunit
MKGSEANVEIDTPNVAIYPQMNIEGSYRILVNSDDETIVDVRKGSLEISTPQGSTQVDKDQRITIQGSADSAQYQVAAADTKD